jgi:hypothetical protein
MGLSLEALKIVVLVGSTMRLLPGLGTSAKCKVLCQAVFKMAWQLLQIPASRFRVQACNTSMSVR